MDEHFASVPELQRGYSLEQLAELVDSNAWQQLTPNNPTAGDLYPQMLAAEQIDAVVGAMLQPSIVQHLFDWEQSWRLKQEAIEHIDIPDVGSLDKVGFGQAKLCYVLTAPSGQRLAVLLGGYLGPDLHRTSTSSPAPLVPIDSHLTVLAEEYYRRALEYNGPRTYACLPVGQGFAIFLREHGGDPQPAGIWLPQLLAPILRKSAMRDANRLLSSLAIRYPEKNRA